MVCEMIRHSQETLPRAGTNCRLRNYKRSERPTSPVESCRVVGAIKQAVRYKDFYVRRWATSWDCSTRDSYLHLLLLLQSAH
jgi:hypothetical protein